jgi:hypothetical protein
MTAINTDTWSRARAAYLAGDTAGSVCRRFRISRSAFFSAAQTGGWRRADRASGETEEAEPTPPAPGEALPCVDLAEAAMARASEAVMNGRLHEAQGWTRLAAELRRMAQEETGRSNWSEALGAAIDAEALGRVVADQLALTSPAKPDSPDSHRTPEIAVSGCNERITGARPDSPDSSPLTGLQPSTALPRNFDQMTAWAESEIARLEMRQAGGP